MPALLERQDQVARARQQLHLVDQLGVAVALRLAHGVADPLLDVVAGDGRQQLVAAHADVAVDRPRRHAHAVVAQRALPRERVVVVGVDERPVDVQQHPHAARSIASEDSSPAIRSSTASSTVRWTAGQPSASAASSGSTPPIVSPPSKRSKTRGSM